jgi:hypothetical protein
MKITAADLLGFGVIDGIIPEPPGGAHRHPEIVMDSTRGPSRSSSDFHGKGRLECASIGARNSSPSARIWLYRLPPLLWGGAGRFAHLRVHPASRHIAVGNASFTSVMLR